MRRLLDDQGYRLHANTKQLESSAAHPDRDQQFEYITEQRQAFSAAGLPEISVDTKKKELIGQFKNAGRVWGQEAEAVNVHDFRPDALGRAVPYGIYDLTHNRGTVYVGQSADTPRFAVDLLARWWVDEGQAAFPAAERAADPGRWRWQQQCPLAGLEAAAPGAALRPATGWRSRSATIPRLLEVEPDRASPVRPDQLELGRPPPRHLGHHARLPAGHHHRDRPDRPRRPPRRHLPDRRIRLRCRHGRPQPHPPRRLPNLELHPAPTINRRSRLGP